MHSTFITSHHHTKRKIFRFTIKLFTTCLPPYAVYITHVMNFDKPLRYFCLFWDFSSYSRIFHLYGDVTITGEGLQILTCARHSWPLSSERATPTVTRDIRLLWSSPRTRDTHTYSSALSSRAITTCFYDLGLSRLGFEHPTYRLRGERSCPLRHRKKSQWIITQYCRKMTLENIAHKCY